MNLAAIRFSEMRVVDPILRSVVEDRALASRDVVGFLQIEDAPDRACSDMELQAIGRTDRFAISQPLGRGAKGCRLDPRGLSAACSSLEKQLGRRPDLLVLNRFGRGEAGGHGFRSAIVLALELEVPVLTAVRDEYAPQWYEFSAGCAVDLPLDRDAILDWCLDAMLPRTAAVA